MASIRGVVNTLLQTAKFGTPLAQSLRVLAAEFREARMTRAEEKAARLPAMLTVPMIVFILPTLFIVVLGPAILSVLDTFSGRARDKPMEVTQTVRPGPPEDPLTANVAVNYAPGKPVKTAEPPPPPRRPLSCRCRSRCGPAISSRSMPMPARLRDGSQHRLVLVPAGTPDDAVDWRPRRHADRAGPGPRVAAGLRGRDRTRCASIMCRRPAPPRRSRRAPPSRSRARKQMVRLVTPRDGR